MSATGRMPSTAAPTAAPAISFLADRRVDDPLVPEFLDQPAGKRRTRRRNRPRRRCPHPAGALPGRGASPRRSPSRSASPIVSRRAPATASGKTPCERLAEARGTATPRKLDGRSSQLASSLLGASSCRRGRDLLHERRAEQQRADHAAAQRGVLLAGSVGRAHRLRLVARESGRSCIRQERGPAPSRPGRRPA